MQLDRTDRRILTLLQQDCSRTNLALAELIGLSPPACLKRVQRLMTQGYIARQVAILAPEKLGELLHIVVAVQMERDHKALTEQFIKRMRDAPEVKQCYHVTGETDFVLIVVVPNMDAYDRFCDRALHSDPNMRKFTTMISRVRSKFDTALDVGAS